MPLFEENNVIVNACTIVWDAITKPERQDDGSMKYAVRVILAPNSPDLPLLEQIAQQALMSSKWRGQLPANGKMPLTAASPNVVAAGFPGHVSFSSSTYQLPQVFSEQGLILQPMQYGPLVFTGQRVNVLVSARDYDAGGGKGIRFQLEGLQIIESAGATPVNFGGSSVNAAAAFGGGTPTNPPMQQQNFHHELARKGVDPVEMQSTGYGMGNGGGYSGGYGMGAQQQQAAPHANPQQPPMGNGYAQPANGQQYGQTQAGYGATNATNATTSPSDMYQQASGAPQQQQDFLPKQ